MSSVRSGSAPTTLVAQVDELAALYRLTDALYRARSSSDVYEAALDAILTTLGTGRASILLFDKAGVMRFVAWRGLSVEYVKAVEGHSPWTTAELDPPPIFLEDADLADEPAPMKAAIKREGIRGLASMPLVAQGVVIGKFMTYYRTPHIFAPHETDLAIAIARQVGFSIERIRAENARQLAEEELRTSEERFRLMSEHAPVMIWISDPVGRCVRLNTMLRTFWGVGEDQIATFDWRDTMHPEDEARITGRMVEATMHQTEVTVKGRFRNADGAYRILETNAKPHFSAKGEFLGMIGVNVDVTEREEGESRLRASEERFRLAVEAAPSSMMMTDAEGRIVLANAQAERLFGFTREELAARDIATLIPDGHARAEPKPLGEGAETRAIRKDGSEVPVEVGLSPIEMSGGPMTLASVVDISYRKQAESQRDLLLAELNHRVKNTLAVVQSIAHQTFRGNDTSPDARAAFEGRLVALATAHNLLTEANWKGASLERVAGDVLQVRDVNRERVTLMGPDVSLQPKEALAIAMALHELSTNATKYGALSNDGGHVSLEWAWMDEPNGLRVVWRERGGPPVTAPTRRGFGSRLVERTVEQDLDGEIAMDFREDGLICSMEAHLPRFAGEP